MIWEYPLSTYCMKMFVGCPALWRRLFLYQSQLLLPLALQRHWTPCFWVMWILSEILARGFTPVDFWKFLSTKCKIDWSLKRPCSGVVQVVSAAPALPVPQPPATQKSGKHFGPTSGYGSRLLAPPKKTMVELDWSSWIEENDPRIAIRLQYTIYISIWLLF